MFVSFNKKGKVMHKNAFLMYCVNLTKYGSTKLEIVFQLALGYLHDHNGSHKCLDFFGPSFSSHDLHEVGDSFPTSTWIFT